MTQEQNMKLMNACESGLQRPDLTVELRRKLLDMMDKIAESGKRADAEMGAFLNEQASYSHSRSRQLSILVAAAVVGVREAAWYLKNLRIHQSRT